MGCLEHLCTYGFLALVCLITLTEGEKDFGPEETAAGLTTNDFFTSGDCQFSALLSKRFLAAAQRQAHMVLLLSLFSQVAFLGFFTSATMI